MRKLSRHLFESRISLSKQGQNGRSTEKSRKQRPLVGKQPSRPKKEPELLIGKVVYIGEFNPQHHGISIILLAKPVDFALYLQHLVSGREREQDGK